MGLLFIVTSGKGGAGKSTVSVGLATAFSKQKKSVLLVDLDEGLRCLDLMLNVSDRLVFDLADIVNHGKDIDDVAMTVGDGISLIAAPAVSGQVAKSAVSDFLADAAEMYDVVIADCPAGIDTELYSALPSYAKLLVVASLDLIGCRSATALNNVFSNCELPYAALIINKFDYKFLHNDLALSLDDIINNTGLPLCGIVPFDTALQRLSANGKLYTKCRSAAAFSRIAKRLCFGNVRLPKLKKL